MAVFPRLRGQQVNVANYVFERTAVVPNTLGMPNHADRYSGESTIPYNVIAGSQRWNITEQGQSYQESWIIRAQDIPLMSRYMPWVATPTGHTTKYPDGVQVITSLPGNPLLICKSISIEPLTKKKAVDPYEADAMRITAPALWIDKYEHLAIATLNFEFDTKLIEIKDLDVVEIPLSTKVGLEATSLVYHEVKIGGEFVAVGQIGTFLGDIPEAGNYVDTGLRTIDYFEENDTGNWLKRDLIPDLLENNDEFEVPLATVIAHLEHKIIWKNVWSIPHGNIKRLLGKINDVNIPWLGNAAEETVLFTGAEIEEQPNRTLAGGKLHTVTYTFSERHIRIGVELGSSGQFNTVILGWNHVYRPGSKSWATVVIDKVKQELLYKPDDFTLLFKHDLRTHFPDILRLSAIGFDSGTSQPITGNGTNSPLRPEAHGYDPSNFGAPPVIDIG